MNYEAEARKITTNPDGTMKQAFNCFGTKEYHEEGLAIIAQALQRAAGEQKEKDAKICLDIKHHSLGKSLDERERNSVEFIGGFQAGCNVCSNRIRNQGRE